MLNKKKIEEIIYGIHPIIELLKAKKRKIYDIYTTKNTPRGFNDILKILPNYTKIHYVDKNILNKISGTVDHQSVAALTGPFVYKNKFFEPNKYKFLILLDGIQDPRNLGAIIRSAYCTNVDGIILPQKNSCSINAVVLKSSAGLAEYMDIFQTSSVENAINLLKKASYNMYMATLNGQNATKINYQEPLCIVIGNEGSGISKNILKYGIHITIPQKNNLISYNASVAAGILLFLISEKTKNIT